jgi:Na+/proline symporter
MSTPDPVAVRRARLARFVKIAKRVGYGALLVAIVAFAVGLATGFPDVLVGLSIAGLVASCVVLPVPIVMGYGIRAAEREDRGGRGRGH